LLAIARVKVLLLIENTTDPLESELGMPFTSELLASLQTMMYPREQLLRDLFILGSNSINLLSIETE
jgi:hypothetical protein